MSQEFVHISTVVSELNNLLSEADKKTKEMFFTDGKIRGWRNAGLLQYDKRSNGYWYAKEEYPLMLQINDLIQNKGYTIEQVKAFMKAEKSIEQEKEELEMDMSKRVIVQAAEDVMEKGLVPVLKDLGDSYKENNELVKEAKDGIEEVKARVEVVSGEMEEVSDEMTFVHQLLRAKFEEMASMIEMLQAQNRLLLESSEEKEKLRKEVEETKQEKDRLQQAVSGLENELSKANDELAVKTQEQLEREEMIRFLETEAENLKNKKVTFGDAFRDMFKKIKG